MAPGLRRDFGVDARRSPDGIATGVTAEKARHSHE
jgi:hypothetical protein